MSENVASPTNTLALLDRLKTEMPEIWGQAQVVGKWVWLEFNVPPVGKIRENLKKLGFHWNGQCEGAGINYTPRPVLEFLTKIACWVWFDNTPNF